MALLDWAYPAEFSDAVEEHRRVRAGAGLFDFSFMAHFRVGGRDALPFVQRVITNDAGRLAPGSALYSPICTGRGMLVDDCTVICRGADEYLITCGLERTFGWLRDQQQGFRVSLEDHSRRLAVIAVQGPMSAEVLADLGLDALGGLAYFRAAAGSLRGIRALVARLGYTGERGYEVFVAADDAAEAWCRLTAAGRRAGLVPCGGLALESLRIEAGYLLTGVDFDESVTPVEAGLERFVRLDKGEFIGRHALAARAEPRRRLAGLRLEEEALARRGAEVLSLGGDPVGHVTSACLSPTLGGGLALAYLGPEAEEAAPLRVDGVPGRAVRVPLPFYDPSRERARAALGAVEGG
jgi:aminomethyltransferase